MKSFLSQWPAAKLLIGAIVIVAVIAGALSLTRRPAPAQPVAGELSAASTTVATTSVPVATSSAATPAKPKPVATAPTHTGSGTHPPVPAAPAAPAPQPHVPQSTPATVSNPSVPTTAGELRAASIPLLAGGTANPGELLPVIYLQVENQSTTTATIHGLRIAQGGTAPDANVIGFSSFDEQNVPTGAVGGTEGATPLVGHAALVPVTATLAPGQRKLFTIKAKLSLTVTPGSTLALSVSGIDANIPVRASFPIRAATWVIGP